MALLAIQAVLLAEKYQLKPRQVNKVLYRLPYASLHPKGGVSRNNASNATKLALQYRAQALQSFEVEPLKSAIACYVDARRQKEERHAHRIQRHAEMDRERQERQRRMDEIAKDPLKVLRRLDQGRRFKVVNTKLTMMEEQNNDRPVG